MGHNPMIWIARPDVEAASYSGNRGLAQIPCTDLAFLTRYTKPSARLTAERDARYGIGRRSPTRRTRSASASHWRRTRLGRSATCCGRPSSEVSRDVASRVSENTFRRWLSRDTLTGVKSTV